MAEYTLLAVVAPAAVVALELLVLRTGLFTRVRFWLAVAIMMLFQIPVDGWLTKPGGTVVHYHDAVITGVRVPWHIPVEDFGFGFALTTLTLLLWQWWRQREARPAADEPSTAAPPR